MSSPSQVNRALYSSSVIQRWRSLLDRVTYSSSLTKTYVWLLATLLMLSACESNDCGEVGDPCSATCESGAASICVTPKICACVYDDEGGESGSGERAGEVNSGASAGALSGGVIGPLECDPPELGELVLNEVMIDSEGDEAIYEFVEIVNLAERPIDLTGVSLAYNGAEKVTFVSGCMDQRSIGALFASEDEWIWSSPAGAVAATKKSFRFSNSGDFTFMLSASSGAELSQMSGSSDLINEGVSLNRDPDFTGSVVRAHSELSTRASSPGLCMNGGRLEEGCPEMSVGGVMAGATAGSMAGATAGSMAGSTAGSVAGGSTPTCTAPAPGDLVINEVLIDPIGDEATEEFVEIVNVSAEARALSGVTLIYNESDKVTFSAGCMAGQSVGVVYGDESRWLWSVPVEGLMYEKRAFRFSNSADFHFKLTYAEEVLSELIGTEELVTEGVSVNRDPELDPTTLGVSLHSELAPGINESPGRCAQGGEIESGCEPMIAPDAGIDLGVGGVEMGDIGIGDMNMGGEATPSCPAPVPGDLIINEALINPIGDENTAEFVEIVNLSAEARALSGVALIYNDNEKVTFNAGCMAGHSVGALYADESLWSWSAPVEGLMYEKRAFRFSNSADFHFKLTYAEEVLSELIGTVELVTEGVSVNRDPDADPATIAVTLHSELALGVDESPGRCAQGGEVEQGCPPVEIMPDAGVGEMGMVDMELGDMGMVDMELGDMGMVDMELGDMGMVDMELGDMGMVDMELDDIGMVDMELGDMELGDMEMSEMGMVDMEVTPCVAPTALGSLLINEALVNPEGNEATDNSEWIEIVNIGDESINLEGVSLWSESALKISFASLCVAPHSALTLYNLRAPTAWAWSSPPLGDINLQAVTPFSLVNSRPTELELKRGEVVLSALRAPTTLIESGVSVNRDPDANPNGEIVKHDTLAGAVGASSPGLCANGGAYEELCVAP